MKSVHTPEIEFVIEESVKMIGKRNIIILILLGIIFPWSGNDNNQCNGPLAVCLSSYTYTHNWVGPFLASMVIVRKGARDWISDSHINCGAALLLFCCCWCLTMLVVQCIQLEKCILLLKIPRLISQDRVHVSSSLK